MRTNYILFAAVALLAACSNDAETTAPRSPAAALAATSVDDAQTAGQAGSSARKGALVVTTVVGPLISIDPFMSQFGTGFATCPAGSTVVGGGFHIQSGAPILKITDSDPVGNTGWRIVGWSSTSAQFRSIARCLQQ